MFAWLKLGENGLAMETFDSLVDLAIYASSNIGIEGIVQTVLHPGETADLTPPENAAPVFSYQIKVNKDGTATITLKPLYSDSLIGEIGKPFSREDREEKIGLNPLPPVAIVASAKTMRVYHIVWVDMESTLKYLTTLTSSTN